MNAAELAFFAALGNDRYVAHAEAALDAHASGHRLWELYDRHFDRFTGAGLDPDFRRLDHTERRLALPRFAPETTAVVVGDGSLGPSTLARLGAIRERIVVIASPQGAHALQAAGAFADIVLVERRQTDGAAAAGTLDAEIQSLDPRTARLAHPAAGKAWTAALANLHVAPVLPSWGLWPVTAVAVALQAGASTVAFVDGFGAHPDVSNEPVAGLMEALAAMGVARCIQLDPVGRPWRGWLAANADLRLSVRPVPVVWMDRGSGALLIDEARADLARVEPILGDARRALRLGTEGRRGCACPRAMSRATEMMLAWGADPSLRLAIQRGLGAGFLPRFWRSGVAMAQATRLWRPLVLGLHEVVGQADRLSRHLETLSLSQTMPRPDAHPGRRLRQAGAPRVSAIVPVLGCGTFASDAVDSLAAQTYADVEIVVVHDVATAGVAEGFCQRHGTRVRRVEVATATLAEALNRGIDVATGDLIAHHDADGASHPERLARQVAYLHAHPDVDVVGACTVALEPGSPRTEPGCDTATSLCDRDAQTPETVARLLREGRALAHGSVLVRRRALERAGGYRPAADGVTIAQDLWMRLLPTTRFAKLPTRLYSRRTSLGSAVPLVPTGARDGHAPTRSECPLADPKPRSGLAALELR